MLCLCLRSLPRIIPGRLVIICIVGNPASKRSLPEPSPSSSLDDSCKGSKRRKSLVDLLNNLAKNRSKTKVVEMALEANEVEQWVNELKDCTLITCS
ncbi:ethylene-responsive transcription factor [Spatholobus suberectus]|nr:ethylene-responsive transcription factor [Spatholobus suberectus]